VEGKWNPKPKFTIHAMYYCKRKWREGEREKYTERYLSAVAKFCRDKVCIMFNSKVVIK